MRAVKVRDRRAKVSGGRWRRYG